MLLPENLFYNTTAPGIILVLNSRKRHKGEILLINASKLFSKVGPRTTWKTSTSSGSAGVYHEWQAEDGLRPSSPRQRPKNDLQPFAEPLCGDEGAEEVLPLEEAVVLLQEAEEDGLRRIGT